MGEVLASVGAGADDIADPKPPPPNDKPPREFCAVPPAGAPPPKIETRSSNGLLDVPERRLAAAGVDDKTSVAARPEGWPFIAGASSKSSRFSACCPATTVCNAF